MVKIENTYDYNIEIHWFSLNNEGGWDFADKEIVLPGFTKICFISEFYYFKVVKA